MIASDPCYPFSGIKRYGYGRELGLYGNREVVDIKPPGSVRQKRPLRSRKCQSEDGPDDRLAVRSYPFKTSDCAIAGCRPPSVEAFKGCERRLLLPLDMQ